MASTGKRHPLLLYARLFSMLRLPTFLIAVLCGGLWWFAVDIPWLSSDLAEWALLGVTLICGLLFLYALAGPALSYVQCFPNYLRVTTPLYSVVISYSRIRIVRPVKFVPQGIGWSQRHFLEPFLGRTIVAIDLNAYPVNETWLRLWLNEFMFPRDSTGLLFITKDWMALSRDLDVHRSEWKTRRIERVASPSVNSIRDLR